MQLQKFKKLLKKGLTNRVKCVIIELQKGDNTK